MVRSAKMGWKLVEAVTFAIAGGCSSQSGTGQWPTQQTGTLKLALEAATPSGVTYQLSNATFEIFNFSSGFSTSVSGDSPSVLVDLAPSTYPDDYEIFLQDGWTLNQVAADGSQEPIPATLITNYVSFTIKPQRTTPVTFQFEVGGEVATTGDGDASVGIQVLEDLIDDFEDGDGQIAKLGGRDGAWFTFNDGSGVETPPANGPVLPEVLDTSANYVLHVTGNSFAPSGSVLADGTTAFGAGVGASLLFDPSTGHLLPYNASAYAGVGFTFTLDFPVNTPAVLSFLVGIGATTPVDVGGTCTSACYDDYGFVGYVPYEPGGFSFSGSFTWNDLRQQGFGTPVPFDPTTITSVKWIVSFPNAGQAVSADAFDFRLDNVTFLPGGFAVRSTSAGAGAADGGAGGAGGVGGTGGPIIGCPGCALPVAGGTGGIGGVGSVKFAPCPGCTVGTVGGIGGADAGAPDQGAAPDAGPRPSNGKLVVF
jgi:hypothetical protein